MKPIYVYIQTDLRLVVFKNLHCQVLFKARSYPVLGAVVLPRLHPSHPWAPHMCVRPRRIIATPLASPLFMLIRLWRPAIVAAVCTCRRPSRRRSPISTMEENGPLGCGCGILGGFVPRESPRGLVPVRLPGARAHTARTVCERQGRGVTLGDYRRVALVD